jgi:Zn-dependent protease
MTSPAQALHTISYMALPLLFAMVLHEYAHGWVANKCGDQTTKLQGRLTLNPLAHVDPFGTIIMPLLCLVLPGVFLCLFNLLPIPPLDGGRLLVSLLPQRPAIALARLEPYGMLILVGLLVFDKELRVIHTIASTFATGLSGTILSTALALGAGVAQ